MKIIIFFFCYLFSYSVYSINISTVSVSEIITNNQEYQLFLKKLEFIKQNKLNEINLLSQNLIMDQKNIENIKSIKKNEEKNIKISKLNNDYDNYKKNLDNLNLFINKNIEYNENLLIKEIIELATNYSIENDIDIILNENHYLVSVSNLDITNFIHEKLFSININFKILDENKL